MKAREVLRLLAQVGYEIAHREGSHRKLRAPGRQGITFAYHDKDSLAPGVVRSILMQQAGLTKEEALEVIRRG